MNFDIRKELSEYIQNVLSACYLLEGMIILMVRKMDRKNIQAAEYLKIKVEKLFKTLFKIASSKLRVILPRYFLCFIFKVMLWSNLVRITGYTI